MPTVICSHCSKVVSAEGPLPDRCPMCGCTLDIQHDSTRSRPQLASTVISVPEQRPTTIGRYIIDRRLGGGGFGWVYLAYDPQLDRQVAIKVPRHDTGTTPAALERFAREGRAAAQLRHEGIISVLNVEDDGELPFIISEYVEGKPLSDRLSEEPRYTFREIAKLVAAIASAVDYAHSKGIIHRDIKPSNVIIATDGTPWLTDFGLAKRETMADSLLTSDRHILGTPAYMSPEQAWGKRGKVDRRTDIYSLGTILYELLTQEIPFRGEPKMVLRQLVEVEPRKPRSLNDEIPLDLETICQKAMEKDASKRYQTAGELSAELNRWLRHEPIHARPITKLERSWRWCRRNPLVAGIVATVAMMLITVACSALVVAGQERKAADASERLAQVEKDAHAAANVAKQKAVEKADELARLNRELSEMVSKSYVERGSQYMGWDDTASDYSPLKALPWFHAAMEIDDKHPTRRDASRLRMGALLQSTPIVKRAWSHGAPITVLAVSPKGDRFFTGSHDGTGRLWSPSQDLPVGAELTHPTDVLAADFSPDGKRLLTGCKDGAIRLWDTTSGKLVAGPREVDSGAAPDQRSYVSLVTFSRDGRLVMAVARKSVHVFATNGLQPVGKPFRESDVPNVSSSDVVAAQFADGERLVVTKVLGKRVSVFDVQTATENHQLVGSSSFDALLVVAPEGKIAAAAKSPKSLGLWDIPSGKELAIPSLDHDAEVLTATFSTDGRRLATGTAEGTVWFWNVADGRLLWKTRLGHAQLRELQSLERGSQLAVLCMEGSARWVSILECDGGNLILEPLHFYAPVRWSRCLEEGGGVLTTGDDGTVRLWATRRADSAFRVSPVTRIAAVSANRRVVAVFADDGGCFVLRGEGQPFSEKTRQAFEIDQTPVSAAISADGSRLAVSDVNSAVAVIDTHTGREIIPRLAHSDLVTRLLFTPDDNLLITVSQNVSILPPACTITAWNPRSGERKRQIEHLAALVTELDVRQKDNLCVIAVGNQIVLWDPVSGRLTSSSGLNSRVLSCRFSPDGRLILTSGVDGVARIWETASLKQLAATPQTRGSITCLQFSPDGTRFVTAYRDGTARLWKVPDARPATGIFLHGATPSLCSFSDDSRWLVTVSDGPLPDNRLQTLVRGWDVLTGELVFTRVTNRLTGQYSQKPARPPYNPWRIAAAFFAPDRHQFHVLTVGGLFSSLDLNPDDRPIGSVLVEVNLRCGAVFDRMEGLSFDGTSPTSSMSSTKDERKNDR
jgi:eukaryotic-like serine/threonine-protein kinase